MKVNVVYKVYLNNRNRIGQFYKEIAKVCSKDENEYLQVALFRSKNKEPDVRYVLGHLKEEELSNYVIL
ncbi:hypothetical protein [Lysinibacillus sp. FSL K6-0102]|uniref:hypothetical protein n=1 Tax=Lysinibacillus sp. FSL K6-0102 TaxID=2975290 RepID=UPI0030FB351C